MIIAVTAIVLEKVFVTAIVKVQVLAIVAVVVLKIVVRIVVIAIVIDNSNRNSRCSSSSNSHSINCSRFPSDFLFLARYICNPLNVFDWVRSHRTLEESGQSWSGERSHPQG